VLDAAGETPLATAQRELREEIELAATDWRQLATLRPTVGISAETQHIFLARGLSHVDRGDFELRGEEAEMEVFWAPLDAMIEAALAGRLTTSALVVALLAYDALRRRDRL
jgi:8-oxo-dGTP pyrophosphatase MutT (NUDIX family)